MNYKLNAFTWPIILAFLPALFGGLGQNLQEVFYSGTNYVNSVAQIRTFRWWYPMQYRTPVPIPTSGLVTITNLCSKTEPLIDKGDTGSALGRLNKIVTTHNIGKNGLNISPPNGASVSEPDVDVISDSDLLYSYWDASTQKMLLRYCVAGNNYETIQTKLYWSKNPNSNPNNNPNTGCPTGQTRNSNGVCVSEQPSERLAVSVTASHNSNLTASTSITFSTRVTGGQRNESYTYAWYINSDGINNNIVAYPSRNASQFRTTLPVGTSTISVVVQSINTPSRSARGEITLRVSNPSPTCTRDVWTCSEFLPAICPSEGTRTRTCTNRPVPSTCPSTSGARERTGSIIPPTTENCILDIVSCVASMRPIQYIFDDLRKNKYVTVNSSSFKQWSKEYPGEIYDEMDKNQTCYARPTLFNFTQSLFQSIGSSATRPYGRVGSKINYYLNRGYPAPVVYNIYVKADIGGQFYYSYFGKHAVIVLEYENKSTSRFEEKFILTVLDSNGPEIDTLTCERKYLDFRNTNYRGVVCSSQNLELTEDELNNLYSRRYGDISSHEIILILKDEWYFSMQQMINPLIAGRNAYCSKNAESSFCQNSPLSRLKNDFPEFLTNVITENNPGICKGWSIFVLKVSFLADFVGQCRN
ncbi:MAG: hypothetical protein COX02_01935 [Candidatus Vogelbacteria bacterium CG22_combo_CG10-13_8_21_14_all_37_9]|uniref:Uncharacterized protein n=1 Tax=Candidatus Vogelbacteria bacterium CG22_combo_CG10-13_8_21_14_all_37_9 TaxID=1975046 RepID=A0A2H0BKA8_9BACT|nr:MAG: hypothetical protein BK005_00895 [bacterium CG10_37_50]PIP58113.1 MAG: hypothetical protein COX02_01935 [Candidatus Vogelbacteria bacterium CG22_combo_CG10-13_8_21_14_all_37_9]